MIVTSGFSKLQSNNRSTNQNTNTCNSFNENPQCCNFRDGHDCSKASSDISASTKAGTRKHSTPTNPGYSNIKSNNPNTNQNTSTSNFCHKNPQSCDVLLDDQDCSEASSDLSDSTKEGNKKHSTPTNPGYSNLKSNNTNTIQNTNTNNFCQKNLQSCDVLLDGQDYPKDISDLSASTKDGNGKHSAPPTTTVSQKKQELSKCLEPMDQGENTIPNGICDDRCLLRPCSVDNAQDHLSKFIPADKFGPDKLPMKYRVPEICDIVNAICRVTCKLTFTSLDTTHEINGWIRSEYNGEHLQLFENFTNHNDCKGFVVETSFHPEFAQSGITNVECVLDDCHKQYGDKHIKLTDGVILQKTLGSSSHVLFKPEDKSVMQNLQLRMEHCDYTRNELWKKRNDIQIDDKLVIISAKPHGGETMIRWGSDNSGESTPLQLMLQTAHCQSCVGAPGVILWDRRWCTKVGISTVVSDGGSTPGSKEPKKRKKQPDTPSSTIPADLPTVADLYAEQLQQSSAARILQELPRYNWLEQKYSSLLPTATTSTTSSTTDSPPTDRNLNNSKGNKRKDPRQISNLHEKRQYKTKQPASSNGTSNGSHSLATSNGSKSVTPKLTATNTSTSRSSSSPKLATHAQTKVAANLTSKTAESLPCLVPKSSLEENQTDYRRVPPVSLTDCGDKSYDCSITNCDIQNDDIFITSDDLDSPFETEAFSSQRSGLSDTTDKERSQKDSSTLSRSLSQTFVKESQRNGVSPSSPGQNLVAFNHQSKTPKTVRIGSKSPLTTVRIGSTQYYKDIQRKQSKSETCNGLDLSLSSTSSSFQQQSLHIHQQRKDSLLCGLPEDDLGLSDSDIPKLIKEGQYNYGEDMSFQDQSLDMTEPSEAEMTDDGTLVPELEMPEIAMELEEGGYEISMASPDDGHEENGLTIDLGPMDEPETINNVDHTENVEDLETSQTKENPLSPAITYNENQEDAEIDLTMKFGLANVEVPTTDVAKTVTDSTIDLFSFGKSSPSLFVGENQMTETSPTESTSTISYPEDSSDLPDLPFSLPTTSSETSTTAQVLSPTKAASVSVDESMSDPTSQCLPSDLSRVASITRDSEQEAEKELSVAESDLSSVSMSEERLIVSEATPSTTSTIAVTTSLTSAVSSPLSLVIATTTSSATVSQGETPTPIDLRMRKSDSLSTMVCRTKGHPPVQMVLPQIQTKLTTVTSQNGMVTSPPLLIDSKGVVKSSVDSKIGQSVERCYPVSMDGLDLCVKTGSVMALNGPGNNIGNSQRHSRNTNPADESMLVGEDLTVGLTISSELDTQSDMSITNMLNDVVNRDTFIESMNNDPPTNLTSRSSTHNESSVSPPSSTYTSSKTSTDIDIQKELEECWRKYKALNALEEQKRKEHMVLQNKRKAELLRMVALKKAKMNNGTIVPQNHVTVTDSCVTSGHDGPEKSSPPSLVKRKTPSCTMTSSSCGSSSNVPQMTSSLSEDNTVSKSGYNATDCITNSATYKDTSSFRYQSHNSIKHSSSTSTNKPLLSFGTSETGCLNLSSSTTTTSSYVVSTTTATITTHNSTFAPPLIAIAAAMTTTPSAETFSSATTTLSQSPSISPFTHCMSGFIKEGETCQKENTQSVDTPINSESQEQSSAVTNTHNDNSDERSTTSSESHAECTGIEDPVKDKCDLSDRDTDKDNDSVPTGVKSEELDEDKKKEIPTDSDMPLELVKSESRLQQPAPAHQIQREKLPLEIETTTNSNMASVHGPYQLRKKAINEAPFKPRVSNNDDMPRKAHSQKPFTNALVERPTKVQRAGHSPSCTINQTNSNRPPALRPGPASTASREGGHRPASHETPTQRHDDYISREVHRRSVDGSDLMGHQRCARSDINPGSGDPRLSQNINPQMLPKLNSSLNSSNGRPVNPPSHGMDNVIPVFEKNSAFRHPVRTDGNNIIDLTKEAKRASQRHSHDTAPSGSQLKSEDVKYGYKGAVDGYLKNNPIGPQPSNPSCPGIPTVIQPTGSERSTSIHQSKLERDRLRPNPYPKNVQQSSKKDSSPPTTVTDHVRPSMSSVTMHRQKYPGANTTAPISNDSPVGATKTQEPISPRYGRVNAAGTWVESPIPAGAGGPNPAVSGSRHGQWNGHGPPARPVVSNNPDRRDIYREVEKGEITRKHPSQFEVMPGAFHGHQEPTSHQHNHLMAMEMGIREHTGQQMAYIKSKVAPPPLHHTGAYPPESFSSGQGHPGFMRYPIPHNKQHPQLQQHPQHHQQLPSSSHHPGSRRSYDGIDTGAVGQIPGQHMQDQYAYQKMQQQQFQMQQMQQSRSSSKQIPGPTAPSSGPHHMLVPMTNQMVYGERARSPGYPSVSRQNGGLAPMHRQLRPMGPHPSDVEQMSMMQQRMTHAHMFDQRSSQQPGLSSGIPPGHPQSPQQHQQKQQQPPSQPRQSFMTPNGPVLVTGTPEQGPRSSGSYGGSSNHTPTLGVSNSMCKVCGKLAVFLCSSCRRVWYCDQQCQTKHWTVHAAECKPCS